MKGRSTIWEIGWMRKHNIRRLRNRDLLPTEAVHSTREDWQNHWSLHFTIQSDFADMLLLFQLALRQLLPCSLLPSLFEWFHPTHFPHSMIAPSPTVINYFRLFSFFSIFLLLLIMITAEFSSTPSGLRHLHPRHHRQSLPIPSSSMHLNETNTPLSSIEPSPSQNSHTQSRSIPNTLSSTWKVWTAGTAPSDKL